MSIRPATRLTERIERTNGAGPRVTPRPEASPEPPVPEWSWHAPAGVDTGGATAVASPEWLAELSEMRGRALYADGRRPAFRLPNGRFADADPVDAAAYHLTVRAGSGIAGCVRLVPLASEHRSEMETLLGPARFQALLRESGTTHGRCAEASRWIVAPEHQRSGLGIHLVAATWALGLWAGLDTFVAMTGSRNGQDRALRRMGGVLRATSR